MRHYGRTSDPLTIVGRDAPHAILPRMGHGRPISNGADERHLWVETRRSVIARGMAGLCAQAPSGKQQGRLCRPPVTDYASQH
jgi:hypothetical protein